MGKRFKALLAALAVLAFMAPYVNAANEIPDLKFKARELAAVKAVKAPSGGKDKNIKVEKPSNSVSKPKANPEKSRASGWGSFRIYNKTGYYMDVYEDGTYAGTISPWSYATWSAFGNTNMYCKVPFDNGDYYHWSFTTDIQTGELAYASPTI